MYTQAVPIYHAIIHAIFHHHNSDHDLCLKDLKDLSERVQALFKGFSRAMHESQMVRSVWLQYVQGFHAWGTERMDDNELKTFDGLSGGHVLVIQALDAFIGLEPLFNEEQLQMYTSFNQRRFISLICKHNFRQRLGRTAVSEDMEFYFNAIAKQLKV